MESQRLMLNYPSVQFKAGSFQPFPASRMAGIQDRHIIFLGHLVNCRKEAQEVLFHVDIFFPVCGQQNVFPLFQSQPGMHVRRLDLLQVVMQHLCHWTPRHIGALLRQPAVRQIPARVLRICQIHVRNDINDPPVGFFRQALILAPVPGLHVENRNMQPLCPNHGQAAVRVSQHQHRVRLQFNHQLIAFGDDIPHRLAQIIAHRVHIDFRIFQFQIMEEYAVQGIVIVLPCMGQDGIKILPAFLDYCCQPDDLRPGSHDNQQLQFPVFLPCRHIGFLPYFAASASFT